MPKLSKQTLEDKTRIELYTSNYKHNIQILLSRKVPAITSAVVMLECLRDLNQLEHYLKKTDYSIFQWCLDHDNLKLACKLIQELIQLIPDRRAFLMVCNDNYSAVRKYINDILLSSPEEYEKTALVKKAMLKEIIAVKPDPVCKLIKEIFEDNKEKPIAMVFLRDVEKTVAELNKTDDALSLSALLSRPSSMFSPSSPAKKRRKYTEEEKKEVKIEENGQQVGINEISQVYTT